MPTSTSDDPFAAPPKARQAETPAAPVAPAVPGVPPGYAAPPAPGYAVPPGYAAPPGAAIPPPPGTVVPPPPAYAQYGYAPQNPYGYAPQKSSKSWMNIVALSAVAGGLLFPFFANVAGIVFGHLGRRAAKRGEANYAGLGLAGLIINYVAVVLWILGIIAYVVFIVWALSECTNNPNSDFCSSSSYSTYP